MVVGADVDWINIDINLTLKYHLQKMGEVELIVFTSPMQNNLVKNEEIMTNNKKKSRQNKQLNRLLDRTAKKQILDAALRDIAIKPKHTELLRYIMYRINTDGYLDTCADKLLVPLKCKSRGTVTKALTVLRTAGYIDVQLVPCKTNRMLHHYRIYIVTSKFPNEVTINNIHYMDINKTNKSILIEKKQIQKKNDQKPKNTTVQDMLEAFNQVAGTNITANQVFNLGLGRYLFQAFKDKFQTMEKWKSYLRKKIFGKIKHGLKFMRFILKFSVINAALAEMDAETMSLESQKQILESKKNEILKKIESSSENSSVVDFRKWLLNKYGMHVYTNWFDCISIAIVDSEPVACSDSKFISDYINQTYFRYIPNTFFKECITC